MQHELAAAEPSVLLIATGDEWLARSIDSILSGRRVSVIRALTGKQALVCARSKQPDAILLESRLPDMDALGLCRALRSDPGVAPHTPVVIVSHAPSGRKERIEALRAGAWDYCDIAPDNEELLLKISTYIRAKVATDHVRQFSLQDDLTGLYNLQGLMRRLQETASEALRHQRPLACLAIAPDVKPDLPPKSLATRTERMGRAVAQACRASDAVARLPSNEFIVVASDTGPPGAQRLAERVLSIVEKVNDESKVDADRIDLHIGFFAVWNFTAAAIRPIDMLMRATSALQTATSSLEARRILSFEASEASTS